MHIHSNVLQISKIKKWLKFCIVLLLSAAIVGQIHPATSAIPPRNPVNLVDLQSMNSKIKLDIRYATTNNFVKQKLYHQARCLLKPDVAEKLSQAQTELETQGLGLKVYDCYRPLSVQKRLWQIKPDPRYVANPANGSRHNRASAVDLTLIDRRGNDLEMPTDFDDFSDRAHRDYPNLSQSVQKNRQKLEQVMVKYGFIPLQTEWWHFDAKDWKQSPILDIPFEAVPKK
jgi:zinc D-Ala-D-Ala dipeptidase